MSSDPEKKTVSRNPIPENRHRFLAGMLASAAGGFGLIQHLLVWSLTAGISLTSNAVAASAILVGILLSQWLRPRSRSLWVTMTGSVVLFGWLQAGLLESLLDTGLVIFGLSTSALILPALLTATLTGLLGGVVSVVVPSARAGVCGIAIAMGLMLMHSVVPFPMWTTLLFLSVLAGVAVWRRDWSLPSTGVSTDLRQLAGLAVIGLGTAAALRLAAVFMPLSIASLMVTGIAVCFVALLMTSRVLQRQMARPLFLWAGLIVAGLPVAAAGWVSAQHLDWNASSQFTVLFFGRGAIAAVIIGCFTVFPVQMLMTATGGNAESRTGTELSVWPFASLLGGGMAGLVLELVPLNLMLVGVVGLVQLVTFFTFRKTERPLRRIVLLPVTTVCLAIVGLNPVNQSAETLLLFSGAAAGIHGQGYDKDVIPHALGVRLLEEHTSENGHLTVWHTHGDEVEFRRNGFKTGACSTNGSITPQPVAESVVALLPMVLHKRPTSVALVGDDTGAGLQAISEFPVDQVDAFRIDEISTRLAARYVWSQADHDPVADERIRITHARPGMAVRTLKSSRRDVIVVDVAQTCSAGGQDLYTLEFYRQVRAGLEEDGVFCQRISEHDIGGDVLIRLISTVDSLFDRALLARISSGDILLMAGPEDLVDRGVLRRMQKPHVTQVLARSGWDWSQLAAIPVIDTHDAFGVFEHIPRLGAATVENAWFAFSLPLETIRRANKAAEIGNTFAPHQRRLADAGPRSNEYAEFTRRFSAVVQQMEILTGFPDQPMPYRKSLRTEMVRNPRPAVETVVDGRIVQESDPRDEYRKEYFLALSEAVLQAEAGFVNPQALSRLTEFAESYEPLLSHFAHHELIKIHEATEHPRPAMEMKHRLHTVYFTEPGDMSVQQVVDALDQLLKDPEILPSADARYDHANSLLQELVRRWEARRGYTPLSSRKTRSDTEASIRVTKAALKQMQAWAKELKLSPSAVAMRRRYLNHQLISPLREYESVVIAHQRKHAVAAALEDRKRSLQEDRELHDQIPALVPEDALTN